MSTKIMTGPVRCVWPALAEPKAMEFNGQASKPKYGVTVLIPKSDKAAVKQIEDFIKEQIAATNWKAGQKAQVTKTALDTDAFNKVCALKDGDKVNARRTEEDKAAYDFYAGQRILKISKKADFGMPGVFAADAKPIPQIDIASEITSGDWIRVQLSAYCYDTPEPGISLQLVAVQKVRKGEPLGQYNPFDAIDDAAAAAAMGVEDDFGA